MIYYWYPTNTSTRRMMGSVGVIGVRISGTGIVVSRESLLARVGNCLGLHGPSGQDLRYQLRDILGSGHYVVTLINLTLSRVVILITLKWVQFEEFYNCFTGNFEFKYCCRKSDRMSTFVLESAFSFLIAFWKLGNIFLSIAELIASSVRGVWVWPDGLHL